MAWKRKTLKPEDAEIIIGIRHPLNYVVSIAGVIKKHGYCKTYVPLDRTFITRQNTIKSLEDQFRDVMRLLSEIFEATIADKEFHEEVKIYVITW